MTEHAHAEYVEGCFRCDLSRDEAEQISPEAEAVRVAGLVLAQELGHTIVGWGDKPAPAPNTQRIARDMLAAAGPVIERQVREQADTDISDAYDELRDALPLRVTDYDQGRLDGMETAARIARGQEAGRRAKPWR